MMSGWVFLGGLSALITLLLGWPTVDHMPSNQQILPPYQFAETFDFNDTQRVESWLQTQKPSTTSDINRIWYAQYKMAQSYNETQPEKACKYWVMLARDPLFPLKDLSFLHAHSTCDPFSGEVHWLSDLESEVVSPWLEKSKMNIQLKNALIRQDDFDVMRFAYNKSKLALPTHQKVQLTRLALEKALLLHDQEMSSSLSARLYKLAPRFNPKPEPKQYLQVANDFRHSRRFESAIYYYNQVFQSKNNNIDVKAKALFGIAKTYKLMRDDDSYLQAMNRYVSYIESQWKRNKKSTWLTRLYHDSQIRHVRALWTKGELEQAQKILTQLERSLKNRFTLAKIYWLRGRMREEKGHFNTAIRWFEHALNQPDITKDFKEDLRWLLAWNLYIKTKRYSAIGVEPRAL
ncbi:MAG: hypothetical protein R2827_12575 [Bdellovibrionales bacterium]